MEPSFSYSVAVFLLRRYRPLVWKSDFSLVIAYAIVGEEKHTGTQDPARGASRARLAAGVREWLHMWGYPWSERNDGIICIDPLTHA